MKTTDRFLIGLVAGVVLLVGVSFAIALLRPKPAYQAEDTPEGVAHNYLLALKQGDYERAYRYLSPTLKGYPASAASFADDIHEHSWNFGEASSTLAIESARVTGNRAVVSVREMVFYSDGLFDSHQYANTFDMLLQRDPELGMWKITASDSYWAWCWDDAGCR